MTRKIREDTKNNRDRSYNKMIYESDRNSSRTPVKTGKTFDS